MSLCSQGWGPRGGALICWHVPTGPEPSGSLADDSDLPRSLKPAGTCGLGQSCWDWREDPAAFTTGLGPEILQRLQKTLERQYPHGQSYSIHPRNASWGTLGWLTVLSTVEEKSSGKN